MFCFTILFVPTVPEAKKKIISTKHVWEITATVVNSCSYSPEVFGRYVVFFSLQEQLEQIKL